MGDRKDRNSLLLCDSASCQDSKGWNSSTCRRNGNQKGVTCCVHGKQCRKGKKLGEKHGNFNPVFNVDSLASAVSTLSLDQSDAVSKREIHNEKNTFYKTIGSPRSGKYQKCPPASAGGETRSENDGTSTPEQFMEANLSSFTCYERMAGEQVPSPDPELFVNGQKFMGQHLEGTYVGIRDPISVEKFVRKTTSFVLYHFLMHSVEQSRKQLGLEYNELDRDFRNRVHKGATDCIAPTIKLYVAYRNSTGDIVHFPIVQSTSKDAKGQSAICYSVGCDHDAPKFQSVATLVKYYTTWTCTNAITNNGVFCEIFPLKNLNIFKEWMKL